MGTDYRCIRNGVVHEHLLQSRFVLGQVFQHRLRKFLECHVCRSHNRQLVCGQKLYSDSCHEKIMGKILSPGNQTLKLQFIHKYVFTLIDFSAVLTKGS